MELDLCMIIFFFRVCDTQLRKMVPGHPTIVGHSYDVLHYLSSLGLRPSSDKGFTCRLHEAQKDKEYKKCIALAATFFHSSGWDRQVSVFIYLL